MLNINDIVAAFKMENKDEFICLVSTECDPVFCKDTKVLDMLEIINPKMSYRLTCTNGRKFIMVLAKAHRRKYKIIDYLIPRLEAAKKKGELVKLKELFGAFLL